MLRKTILRIIILFPVFSHAQNNYPVIKGSAPSFYIDHTVGAKENYYSIGRLYNSSPSMQIAPFNNQKMEDGLKVGQAIRIPLNEGNFTQEAGVAADEALVPVQHIAGEKESLWSISSRYNKVPVASIKKWNKLEKEQVSAGARLTVGFLKVKKDQSSLSSLAVSAQSMKSMAGTGAEAGKDVAKKEEAAVNKNVSPEPEKNVDREQSEKEKRKSDNSAGKSTDVNSGKHVAGGFFKSAFDKQESSRENRSGSAGVFKSTSGWDDGKYYCLYNDAAPGTIVKVINSSNKKFVYAKVLDAIPDMKQNEGLIIRISNAAAGELEVSGNSFDCSVSF